MKKKSKLTKVLALCLALVMMLAMSVPVSADISNGNIYSFSVSGFDEKIQSSSILAYQIITVNVDSVSGQPENPMYMWASEVQDWVRTYYSNYIKADGSVADVFENSDDTQFLEKMAAAIKTGTIQLTGITPTTFSSSTATFDGVSMGEYLIIATGGVKIYQPTTVQLYPVYSSESKEWNVSPAVVGLGNAAVKSSDPGISEKEGETEEGDNTVAIGDKVTYTLTVNVPSYPEDSTHKKFTVSDKLSTGLTFDGIQNIHIYTDKEKRQEVEAKNYSISTDVVSADGQTRTFEISFNDQFFEIYGTTTVLYVVYSATVNENAFGNDALGNDAFLGYNNDPYQDSDYETPGTHEDVYTYGMTIQKVGKDGTAISDSPAEFHLSDANGNVLKFKGSNGDYTYDAQGDPTLSTSNGILNLKGLDTGTYKLVETKAPSGYVLPNGEITIIISDQGPDGEADGTIDEENISSNGTISVVADDEGHSDNISIDKNNISFKVINTSSADANFTLPATGGMGTMIFTIGGILLMAAAIAMVVIIYKKRRAE